MLKNINITISKYKKGLINKSEMRTDIANSLQVQIEKQISKEINKLYKSILKAR